jgi:hypothetical protein
LERLQTGKDAATIPDVELHGAKAGPGMRSVEAAWGQDGQSVVAMSERSLALWRVSTQIMATIDLGVKINGLAVASGQGLLATANEDNMLLVGHYPGE